MSSVEICGIGRKPCTQCRQEHESVLRELNVLTADFGGLRWSSFVYFVSTCCFMIGCAGGWKPSPSEYPLSTHFVPSLLLHKPSARAGGSSLRPSARYRVAGDSVPLCGSAVLGGETVPG